MERVIWFDEIVATPDNGTMLIHARSGTEESECRVSFALFRRYAEQGLRDLNTYETGARILPFGRAG